MAKSKVESVRERIILIEKWARDGLTEDQIAKNLGISRATLCDYKNKHIDILNALKKGREVLITEVENALIKKALGFEYVETKVSKRNENGTVVEYVEKTTKVSPPDTGACAFILKNKAKDHWTDNPQKVEIEKRLLEIQERALALKEF